MLKAICTNYAAVGGGHAQSGTDLSGAQVLRHVHPRPEMLVRSIDKQTCIYMHACTH